ncbi:MAG TPA: AAA family ATPase, partial [Anaerolineales bacterium]|nr:AAA family ATPase [Anaerolineales bacterium]
MTLISAPAGFGKTTLASEWIARCERPAAWLSLDEEDGDPARFWSHFIAALQTLALSGGDGLAATLGAEALRALQSPQPPSGRSLLAPLLNEIASIPDPFVLVLDDYHLVDSPDVSHALAFLIERLPPQMHLVIATRDDPDLPLARLRARDQLTELRVKDLRFTDTEAAEYLTQAMGLRLSTDDVLALETRTEGWIVGLQLAALSMQGLPDPGGMIPAFTGSHHYVLDYLLEEVLHKQPVNLQTFLLQTSILDRMCGPLCEAVLLHPRIAAQQTLEHLERANLFVVPLDQERRWYRYHHLFRDLLRQRLLHQDPPEAVARLHIHASEWLEANGGLAEAFQHALAGGEVDRAARLAESAWQAMNTTFQMGAWLRWVNQLPPSAIRARPVLCTQMGLAYMDTGNVQASEASLRDAEQGLRRSSDDIIVVEKDQLPALPARIAFARAYNAQSQGRVSDAAAYAQKALELTPIGDV